MRLGLALSSPAGEPEVSLLLGSHYVYSTMHLKPSCWQGLLEALRDSDTRGLLQEHGQRIPLPRGACGVMASHASDGYPSPPARALGGPGVHRRRAASPGGRTPVGPQPRDGGGVGPTRPGPWAQRLAAPGSWAAGHRAPSGRMGATAARRGASAPSGGLADRHLVGARSRGVGQTHVQDGATRGASRSPGDGPGAGHHQAPSMVPAGDDGSVPSDAPPWPAGQTPRSGHGQGAASSGRDRGASPRASASDRPSMTT